MRAPFASLHVAFGAVFIALNLAACSSGGGSRYADSRGSGSYKVTDAEKVGETIRLTLATDWRGIQCNASYNGLKLGSGLGNTLAGVAKVRIYLPSKYATQPVTDFKIECTAF